jgi:crotonobetainyl-CoA:carnitine CoA-transferase CaiB-like acyl-CoA transferase
MGDRNGGMALAFGVAAGLMRRERTGHGGVVDVSLLATAMATLSSDLLAALNGTPPTPTAGRESPPNPLVNTFRTKDGRHIQLVFLDADRYWVPFCALLERQDLLDDPRFVDLAARRVHSAACVAELDEEFARRTLQEWEQVLADFDGPWAPVRSVTELIDDPQVIANGYIGTVQDDGPAYRLPNVPVQFDGQSARLRRAPELGEHTEAVLLELGYAWEDIASLQAAGAIP